jgi:hypothetical protein
MADNVGVKEGADKNIATDEISGAHYQRGKLIYGADGVNEGDVDKDNGLPTQPERQATATVTNGTASTATITLAASNTSRKGLVVYNNSTSDMYLKYGSGGNPNDFTVKILAGGYWEMPAPIYTGIVTGAWDSVNGNAKVTEI